MWHFRAAVVAQKQFITNGLLAANGRSAVDFL